MTEQTMGGRFNWRIAMWGGACALLALPFVAMQFTREVAWGPEDFVVMGIMLAAALGAFEFLARVPGGPWFRVGSGLAILGMFLLVWVNLAVGIIGSEDNPHNLFYAAVIAILISGACATHFRPAGLAWSVVAAAVVQIAIGAAAVVGDWGADGPIFPRDVIGVTVIFTGLWATAAAAFALAAKRRD